MTGFGADTLERLRSILPARVDGPLEAGRRAAAVLIPLCVASDEIRVVLTKRSSLVRHHKAEVCFPGGSRDPHDPSLERTALREAEEEIGLRPADAEILGMLEDMPTAVSGYIIRPFVAQIPFPYPFVPDPGEVDRILLPALSAFADPALQREEMWERDGGRFPITFFDIGDEVVWGATARLLKTLLDRIAGREPEPVRIPRS